MKTVFIIAGLDIHQTATGEDYRLLRDSISKKGYKVIPVDISWRRKTPSQFAKMFVDFYLKNKGSHNIIIGNSFGAAVAFISASQIQPDELFICSLSPFFMEDPAPRADGIKSLGKRRIEDIRHYKAQEIADQINKTDIKVKVIYGQKEQKSSQRLVNRSKQTAKMLNDSKLIEITNAGHSFHQKSYLDGICSELK